MKIFSAEQIRKADEFTIKHEQIASIDLMEHAALTFLDKLLEIDITASVTIFCGHGNNGGDGLAIARLLLEHGTRVITYVVAPEEKYSIDFKTNLDRLKRNKEAKIVFIKNEKHLPAIKKDVLIIDALFGTGLSKPVTGIYKKVIQHINKSGCNVISVDMPSGLYADVSSLQNADAIVKATHTLTFQFYKLAFMFAENAEFFGRIHLLDIGLSEDYILKTKSEFEIIDNDKVKSIIKIRKSFSHKGNYGHALLIAGSNGKMGAAVLASKACLRSGVGLLTVHIPSIGYSVLQTAVPEAMCIIDSSLSYVTEKLDYEGYATVGIGPGIESFGGSPGIVQHLISSFNKPIVIDADGLNVLALNKSWLKQIPANSILTPHPKEFERLFGKTENNFERNKLQMECSKKYNVVIVLKGKHTCITSPDGICYFNGTGNPGMAKGGSGDVLTGMITAFLAQGYVPFDAAIACVYLHGLAGDIGVKNVSEYTLVASDIINNIGNAFVSLNDFKNQFD